MVAPLITDVAVSQHHLSSSQEAAAAVSNASLQCRVQVQCSAMQSKGKGNVAQVLPLKGASAEFSGVGATAEQPGSLF